MQHNKVQIKEIFESIQGEGPYIGINQLFIRFSKCNLKCKYCDTDFTSKLKFYTVEELINITKDYTNIHSISLTGGEPLLEKDFLLEFLPKINKKIYLETNGTLYENLSAIIDYVDIIAMDIKLPSSSENSTLFDKHEKFIEIGSKKELFIKLVFNEKITDEEIKQSVELAKKYNNLIVLQPQMFGEKLELSSETINKTYYKFISQYDNVRLIPQVHKFLKFK